MNAQKILAAVVTNALRRLERRGWDVEVVEGPYFSTSVDLTDGSVLVSDDPDSPIPWPDAWRLAAFSLGRRSLRPVSR